MRFVIIFTLASVLLASCGVSQQDIDKFGLQFNAKRKAIGLPLLDSSWRLVKNSEGALSWHPVSHADSLVYLSKIVQIDDARIKREENLFLGKQKYHTVDGDLMEELYISCYFDDAGNLLRWDCKYWGAGFEFGNAIKKDQADSLIKKWQIKTRF